MPSGVEQRTDEQLVAVRPDVLNDVEHAVGNLLQRMHHAARSARSGSGAHGERLQTTLEELERLLELLFDYVSPVDVQVRAIDAGVSPRAWRRSCAASGAGNVDDRPGRSAGGARRSARR